MPKDRANDPKRKFFPPTNFKYEDDEQDEDFEPTDKQMNPHYYSDTSSFTEGGITYGKGR